VRPRTKALIVVGVCLTVTAAAVVQRRAALAYLHLPGGRPPSELGVVLIEHPRSPAERIVNGAKLEVLRGVSYDASYRALPYPMGDVPTDRGACTEVIIRGLRNAGYDLQQLLHEDMARDFAAYPHLWGLPGPDPNIDHRRVPNHIAFLQRHGEALPLATTGAAAATWQPGDLVYWQLGPSRLTHCGVVSNDRGPRGLPLVLHNMGAAAQEDCLDSWKIIGHFRYPRPSRTARAEGPGAG
jgi:hypothetical protein